MLDKAGDQKISDDVIMDAFQRVRQKTLALAKGSFLSVDQNPVLEPDARKPVLELYGGSKWTTWKHKDRELRVRALLFNILHYYILDEACFGIEGFGADSPEKRGFIATGLSDLEAEAIKKNGELEANQA